MVAGLFGDLGEGDRPGKREGGRARLREPVRDEVTFQVCDGLLDEARPARLIWAYASRIAILRPKGRSLQVRLLKVNKGKNK